MGGHKIIQGIGPDGSTLNADHIRIPVGSSSICMFFLFNFCSCVVFVTFEIKNKLSKDVFSDSSFSLAPF